MDSNANLITDEFLESFFEENLDIMCILNSSGGFLKVNQAWRNTLGYSLDDLKDISVFELIHEDYKESTTQFILDKKNIKDSFIVDIKCKSQNGLYKSFECKVHVLKDVYFITARDITSWIDTKTLLKKSQAQMKKSLDLQSLISNTAYNLISGDNFDSEITSAISKIGEFLGLSRVLVFVDSLSINSSYLKYSWFNGNSNINAYVERVIDYDSIPSYKSVISTEHLVFSDDLSSLPFDLRTHFLINKVDSFVAFPLYLEGKVRGIVRFDCCTSNYPWHPSTVESLRTFSKIISSSYDKSINSLKLKESQKSLDMFFNGSKDGFFFMMLDEPILWNDYVDKDEIIDYVFSHQRVTRCNQAVLAQYNSSEEDFLGKTPCDFYKGNLERGKRLWKTLFEDGVLHLDGYISSSCDEKTIIQGDYVCLYDESGRITGHFGVQRDVTNERISQNLIFQSERRFLQLAENIEEIFWIRESDGINYVNSAFERVTGMPISSLKDDPSLMYGAIIEEDKPKFYKKLSENPYKFDVRYRIKRPDGKIIWIWERGSTFKCPITNIIRSVGVSADITHMKELEEKLKITSTVDGLTQIYNRKYVFDRLGEISKDYMSNEEIFSFAILDIDFFKNVNDNFGHTAGDFILKEFAKLIEENIRSSDLLGRYGGEEFVVVLKGTNKKNAYSVIEKILEVTRNTVFEYDGDEIRFTFSGGISDACEFNSSNFNLTELVNLADERLYEAKRTGRNKIVI